jgi:hypothetical protein
MAMNPEYDTVRFTMLSLDLEWSGAKRVLTGMAYDPPAAVLKLIRDVIVDCSATHIPAAVAVDRAGKRLAQPITNLQVTSEGGGRLPRDAQG